MARAHDANHRTFRKVARASHRGVREGDEKPRA